MGIIKSIKKRIVGEYRRKEKLYLEKRKIAIEKILEGNKIPEGKFKFYLEGLKEIIIKIDKSYSLSFFLGSTIARNIYGRYNYLHYELLSSIYGEKDFLVIEGLKLPKLKNRADQWIFMDETPDLLLPYLFERYDLKLDGSFYNEGPYELNDQISLKKGDCLIDCGANMGIFSAVASAKNCRVYSFEPMKYTIEKYLSKTASLNVNITICPFALSDKKEELFFDLDIKNIGASKECAKRKKETQLVQAITLDSFVEENNIEKVDFIKADIEGSERKMLLGAENVIKKFSPKISICTYHLPDDPRVLREILLEFQPKYKITEAYMKMYATVE